jgi:hypothetical protein
VRRVLGILATASPRSWQATARDLLNLAFLGSSFVARLWHTSIEPFTWSRSEPLANSVESLHYAWLGPCRVKRERSGDCDLILTMDALKVAKGGSGPLPLE